MPRLGVFRAGVTVCPSKIRIKPLSEIAGRLPARTVPATEAAAFQIHRRGRRAPGEAPYLLFQCSPHPPGAANRRPPFLCSASVSQRPSVWTSSFVRPENGTDPCFPGISVFSNSRKESGRQCRSDSLIGGILQEWNALISG